MKRFRYKRLVTTVGAGLLVCLALVVIAGLVLAWPSPLPVSQIEGVTFSAAQARSLGLDWKETYQAILNDLAVTHLRLGAYWDEIEPNNDVFHFADLDYQMKEARAHDAHIILAIGRKIPRWPECHIPEWAQGFSAEDQQAQVLSMLRVVVERYKDDPALRMWQLENEPFLDFGICPPANQDFYRQEEDLVRSLDPNHQILVTDSGELNLWLTASRFGDVLGTTMYRTVFSKRTQHLFRYDYIFPAWEYRLKARYIHWLRRKSVIISELQGEPWGQAPFVDMTQAERQASFSPARFRQLYTFAQRTQLPEAYWWGVEYWYWEKTLNGNAAFWDYAKKSVFQGQ